MNTHSHDSTISSLGEANPAPGHDTIKAPFHHIYTDETMKVIHVNDHATTSDLYMYYCGIEPCEPGHTFGPAIREHYVIHYIVRGKGMLLINGQEYHLQENQGFLLCPGIVSKYIASETEPWEYIWVGFHGSNAASYLKLANLSADNPVFTYDKDDRIKDCLSDMVRISDTYTYGANLKMQSLLYQFMADLVDNNTAHLTPSSITTQYNYVRKALECIQLNYMNDLNVNKLSEYVNLNRSYLCSIFKKALDISPQAYITQYRINKSCEFLQNPTYSITDISLMVGYKDYAVYQRSFKKILNMSPSDYRKSLQITSPND